MLNVEAMACVRYDVPSGLYRTSRSVDRCWPPLVDSRPDVRLKGVALVQLVVEALEPLAGLPAGQEQEVVACLALEEVEEVYLV